MAKDELSLAPTDPIDVSEGTLENAALKAAGSNVPETPIDNDKSNHKNATEINSKGTKPITPSVIDDLEDVDVSDNGLSVNDKVDYSTGKKDSDKTNLRLSDNLSDKSSSAAKERPESGKSTEDTFASLDAPPQPPRPVSPSEQIKRELQDAFPQIESKYIEAFLIASEGRIDPAFNALLYLSDPSFKPEPVSVGKKVPATEDKPMYTDDELLARQLQKEFDREERRQRNAAARARQRKAPQPIEEDESPDELELLKKEFTQGFEEARTTINGWVSGLTKKFTQDGDSGNSSGEKNQNTKLFGALGGSSFNSGPKTRARKFDEDPEILSSDFSRRVDLQEKDVPKLPARTNKLEQEKRWQPLNSDVPVNPNAFLVTDSEDEDRK